MISRFRPFRIVRNKVVVTSCMCWHKLVCDIKYRNAQVELFVGLDVVLQMEVTNHEGEKLYWPLESAFEEHPILRQNCYDVQGTPVFSHLTKKRTMFSDYYYEGCGPHCYEPLTTNIIVREFYKLAEIHKMRFAKLLTTETKAEGQTHI